MIPEAQLALIELVRLIVCGIFLAAGLYAVIVSLKWLFTNS